MIDHTPLLASLLQLLTSRLAFRKAILISALQEKVGYAATTGNLGSGRIGIVMAQAFESEAQSRAELVGETLRQSRLSWSSAQIIQAQRELRTSVCELCKENLSQAAELSEQIGTIRQKRQQPQNAAIVTSFLDHADQASKAALAMVDATISEIVAAAGNDMAAKTFAERPTYVVNQTFQGPVASVAHGDASVGSVQQSVGSATPNELAEAVAAVIRALPTDTLEGASTKAELQDAETELRGGRVPFARLTRLLGIFGKAEDIAIRAPEAADHIARLGSMLGLG